MLEAPNHQGYAVNWMVSVVKPVVKRVMGAPAVPEVEEALVGRRELTLDREAGSASLAGRRTEKTGLSKAAHVYTFTNSRPRDARRWGRRPE